MKFSRLKPLLCRADFLYQITYGLIGTSFTSFFCDFRVKEQFDFCNPFVAKLSGVTWRLMSRSLLLPLKGVIVMVSSGLKFINPAGLYDPSQHSYTQIALAPPGRTMVYISGQG
jgi:hypothetical protein